MRYRVLLLLVLCISWSAFSQEHFIVRGIVRNSSTHEALVFANIAVAGTQLGTVTDSKGQFQVSLPHGNYVLRCTYVGYKTAEVPVSAANNIRLTINLDAVDILLQDVTVYAYQGGEEEPATESVLSLQSEQIKTSTSVIPDVLRSVQLLPGVSANNEFSAKFNVRGGNQDENLILVNGTQVYDPYHVKEVPNASISIMQMDLIKNMDLMTGGFPARYGDKMSSVADIEYREGNRERYKGTASVSLTDANVVAEGPLGENGSFLLGARKSYFEYLLKYTNFGSYHHPSFYDIQGVVDYSLDTRHKLLLKFFNAGDTYTQDPLTHQYLAGDPANTEQSGDSLNNRGQYYSTLFSLQSINIISSSTIIKAELSVYDENENERFWTNNYSDSHGTGEGEFFFDTTYNAQLYRNNLHIRTLELNSNLDWQASSLYDIKTGVSYQRISFDQNQSFLYSFDEYTNTLNYPDTSVTHETENILDAGFNNLVNTHSWKFAGYIENLVQLSDRLSLNVGGRCDYFDLNKALTWSPRVQLAYRVPGGLTLRAAWGYYFQSPIIDQIAYAAASDTNTQPQKAIHYVLGADYRVYLDREERSFLNVKVEGYYKNYENLMSSYLTSSGLLYYSRKNDAVGSSKGVDVYMTCSVPGFYGWVSYGYLISLQNVLNDAYGSFPRNTDQRHTLAAVGEWDLGKRWKFGVRFVYGSGYPFTPLSAQYDSAGKSWGWVSGTPNAGRLPSYSRVDLRVAKEFGMFGLPLSAFLDISNVFNTHNVQSYRYTFDGNGLPVKDEINLWPILPSIGMSVRF